MVRLTDSGDMTIAVYNNKTTDDDEFMKYL